MSASILSALALSFQLLAVSGAAPTGASATDTFVASQGAVAKLVHDDASDSQIQQQVDGFFDYRWLAEQSLGGAKKFESRCAPRCDEFEGLLTRLIRHNYLTRVKQSDKGSVQYVGEQTRKNGTMAKVDTKIGFERDGRAQSIAVSYVMHQSEDGWKVRDIHTDGVGLAKTYRHEFKKTIDQGGIDLLIERLQAKVDAI